MVRRLLAPHAPHAAQSAHHAPLHSAALTRTFEHLTHLGILAQQLIHFLHRGSRSARDPLAAASRDNLVLVALLLGHRVDDGLNTVEFAFIHLAPHLPNALKKAD